MLWEDRLKREQFSIDAAMLKGRALPEWYLQEPYLLPGEEFYLTAFYRLSADRAASGLGIGCIPYTSRVLYAERAGFDGFMVEAFVDILGVIDGRYVSRQEERISKEQRRLKQEREAAAGKGSQQPREDT